MKLVRRILATVLLFSLSVALFALQRQYGYQGYGRQQYSYGPAIPSEFYWSRLQYTSSYANGGSYGFRGFHGGGWSRDYPKADNDCLIALRRLTHINSPSPLNVVDHDSDHIYDYPWIYAVQVNTWTFTDDEAKRLHDYLLKGGFLMVDDFHGTDDWEHFMAGMRMVLPDSPVEDLKDSDEIYHVLYDINEKFQIPSEVYVNTGRTYEKDGYVPKWRAIRNDHGASWWPSAPTCISATPGSGPTARSIPRSFPDLLFASSSTTLLTP
jgi:hypothetical protein